MESALGAQRPARAQSEHPETILVENTFLSDAKAVACVAVTKVGLSCALHNTTVIAIRVTLVTLLCLPHKKSGRVPGESCSSDHRSVGLRSQISLGGITDPRIEITDLSILDE